MTALLVIKGGPVAQAEHELDPARSYVVGRSRDADIVVQHPSVSRGHFKLSFAPSGRWLVTDLGSANGTIVNRRRVATAVLDHGDVMRVGLITLELRVVGAAVAEPPAPAMLEKQVVPPAPPVLEPPKPPEPAPAAARPRETRSGPRPSGKLILFGATGFAGLALAGALAYLVLTGSRRPPTHGQESQKGSTATRPTPVARVSRKPPRVGTVVRAIKLDGAKDISPLHAAVIEGKLEAVQALLDKGADPNARSAAGTPLHVAAANNDVLMALLLLDRGGNIAARDAAGRTPLHLAAIHGAAEAAEFLIEEGAAVTSWTSDGLTPMHLAAGNGHVGVLKVLLAAGADPNQPNSYGHRTPLHEAAAAGQLAAAELLLAKGADANARTSTVSGGGSTPLHEAARGGRAEMVRFLLSRGADPAARNSDGRTPRDEALAASHTAVAALLAPNAARPTPR